MINPVDEGWESGVDEERIKELVWPKLALGVKEKI